MTENFDGVLLVQTEKSKCESRLSHKITSHHIKTHESSTILITTTMPMSRIQSANERRHRKVEESVPASRSMRIISEGPYQERRPLTISGKSVTWPSLPIDHSVVEIKRSNSKEEGESCEPWELDEKDLRELPKFYVLDRSSVKVEQPVDRVLAIIGDFLRIKSITSFFYRDEGKIYCQTPNLLHFVIYFWRASDGKVIVELQRRQGSTIEMQCIRREIWKILDNKKQRTNSQWEMDHPCHLHKTICPLIKQLYNCDFQVDEETDRMNCREDGMNICHDLLESRCEDQNRLGMESLVNLTDPSISLTGTSEHVARALVSEDSDCGDALRHALYKYLNIDPILNHEKDFDALEHADDIYHDEMHSLALQALANILEVVVDLHAGGDINIDFSKAFWRSIIENLKNDLKDPVQQPTDAAIACHCLTLLKRIDAHVCFDCSSLRSSLIQAQHYGSLHHLQLERDATALLNLLNKQHS